MLPTVKDGEKLHTQKLDAELKAKLVRGDIIVFKYPKDPSKGYIKRLIGLPGETVEIKTGEVWINGNRISEPYVDSGLNISKRSLPAVVVPAHSFYVLGDNRDNSNDSRSWGFVPEELLISKVSESLEKGFLNRFLMWLGVIDEPSMLFVYNLNAVLLTLAVLLLPFAILPIFLSLERIPRRLLEASSDLGGSGWQTFWMVILPLSLPGVIAAATFVFVLALGDFLTPQMVGGQSGFTFGRIIYSQFGAAFNWPFGAALSVILAIAVMVAIVIGAWFGNRAAARGGSR